jgi:hypothetical protein
MHSIEYWSSIHSVGQIEQYAFKQLPCTACRASMLHGWAAANIFEVEATQRT